MIATRPSGTSTRFVSLRTRAGSPNSFSEPPQTAPAKTPLANGKFSASARTKEGASPLRFARRARKIGVSPSFARANAENLPFADASFDGAVCGGSLNEFGDPARTLRERRRVLKPGGRVAIMGILKARSTWGKRLQRLLSAGGVCFFEPNQVMSLLDHAGLEPDPLKTHGAVFFAGATRR